MEYKFTGNANYICAQLYDAFKDADVDIENITTWNRYKTAIIKAGLYLNKGIKGKIYKDFIGKVGFPLFVDYFINSQLFTDSLGVYKCVSEWDLLKDDHGVDALLYLADDRNEMCTAQLKFKSNPNILLDRNKDNAGNFYEASVEEYSVTTRNRMVWISNSIGMNKNMQDYNRFIDGHRITHLTKNKKKLFWDNFFDAVEESAKNARIERPTAGVTSKVYSKSQQDFFSEVLDNAYSMKTIQAGCGAGKGDAIGKKVEQTFTEFPGSICTVGAARLQLLGELSQRIYSGFSSESYVEATFSSRKDWNKEHIIDGDNANKKVFASTRINQWIEFFEEEIVPYPERNLLIWVCYTSYENFAKMLQTIEAECPAIWEAIENRLKVEHRDEVHNLTSSEKNLEDQDEDRRLKRIITESLPFLNRAFDQNVGFSATVPDFIFNHPEIYGDVVEGPDQPILQQEGITLPLIPIVVWSDDEVQNSNLVEDDKDLTYFKKVIDLEIEQCKTTGQTPKVIIWTRSATITGYFESKIKELYKNALVGSMTANTSYKERYEFFEQFKASTELSVLFNYDIVSEGTDIDGAGAVAIGRTVGQIKLTQIAGRPVRMALQDRQELAKGNISVNDRSNWLKPEGRIYLYEESDSLSSSETITSAVKFLCELNESGLTKIKDAKHIKKPKGANNKQPPGAMDEPEAPNPDFVENFYKALKKVAYRTKYVKMNYDEMFEVF